MREIAETLDVHIRTVQEWHKKGLAAIDEEIRPLLFMGNIIKDFLKNRRAKRKCRLGDNECLCLRCHKGVVPEKSTISVNELEKGIGKDTKQIMIKGICPNCGVKVSRLYSSNTIKNSIWAAYITIRESEIEG